MDCGVARLIPSAGEKAGSFCKAPSFVLVFQRSELAIAINTPLGCSEEIIPALVPDTLVDRGNFSVFFSFIGEGSCDFPQRAILLPVKSVGVMGDERTYESCVALRAVTSTDGMTADWVHLPYEFLANVSNDIINKVKGVNRVVYDISSKPPATIEWE